MAAAPQPPSPDPRTRTLELTAEEAALLRDACLRYRARVPSYLEGAQQLLRSLDRLLELLR